MAVREITDNRSPLDRIRALPPEKQRELIAGLDVEQRNGLQRDWRLTRRPAQNPFWEEDWRIRGLISGRATGKALDVATPIATPEGWTEIGKLRVGDRVYDEQGNPCTVTGVYPQGERAAWEVRFNDGEALVADEEHLWTTTPREFRRQASRKGDHYWETWTWQQPITTQELADTLRYGKRGDLNHAIELPRALAGNDIELPVPPYVLGAWLGDGDTEAPWLSCHKDDFLHYRQRFEAEGVTLRDEILDRRNETVLRARIGAKRAFYKRLQWAGVWGDKHIPAPYLRAAYPARLALLQGLMDTDGSVDKRGKGVCEFTSMSRRLAEGVRELLTTLSVKATLSSKETKLYGREMGTSWRVIFTPHVQVFSLQRKAKHVKLRGQFEGKTRRRVVEAVGPLGEAREMCCVAVDSPSRLYLAGRAMIPTHNTWVAGHMVEEAVVKYGYKHIGIIARTYADFERTVLGGPSGLRSLAHPPRETEKGLFWDDYGARATLLTAEKPDSGRGMQFDFFWGDEMASWYRPRQAKEAGGPVLSMWDHCQMMLRHKGAGRRARGVVTTTPKNIPDMHDLIEMDDVLITTESIYDNHEYIDEGTIKALEKRFKNTRAAQQELMGQILKDVENALWTYDMIDNALVGMDDRDLGEIERLRKGCDRIVVSIDPAMTANIASDYTGICVMGVLGDDAYVFHSERMKESPDVWARRAVQLYDDYEADCLIAEVNNGGDLVEMNIRASVGIAPPDQTGARVEGQADSC